MAEESERNILGGELEPCSFDPNTGFYRDGHCRVGEDDIGCHAVCCQVTEEFLEFSKAHGNDLSTPAPGFGFPGLKPGDRWCICASRWRDAHAAGFAPPIILAATSEKAVKYVPRSVLEEHGMDPPPIEG